MASKAEYIEDYTREPRFVGDAINLVDNLGQSFGWWEGQKPPDQGTYVVMPEPIDYTNTIIGVAAGLAAVVLIAIIVLR